MLVSVTTLPMEQPEQMTNSKLALPHVIAEMPFFFLSRLDIFIFVELSPRLLEYHSLLSLNTETLSTVEPVEILQDMNKKFRLFYS